MCNKWKTFVLCKSFSTLRWIYGKNVKDYYMILGNKEELFSKKINKEDFYWFHLEWRKLSYINLRFTIEFYWMNELDIIKLVGKWASQLMMSFLKLRFIFQEPPSKKILHLRDWFFKISLKIFKLMFG